MRLRRGSMLLRSGSKFNAPAARFKWFNAATQRSRFKVQGFKEAVASSASWLRFLAIPALPRCL